MNNKSDRTQNTENTQRRRRSENINQRGFSNDRITVILVMHTKLIIKSASFAVRPPKRDAPTAEWRSIACPAPAPYSAR